MHSVRKYRKLTNFYFCEKFRASVVDPIKSQNIITYQLLNSAKTSYFPIKRNVLVAWNPLIELTSAFQHLLYTNVREPKQLRVKRKQKHKLWIYKHFTYFLFTVPRWLVFLVLIYVTLISLPWCSEMILILTAFRSNGRFMTSAECEHFPGVLALQVYRALRLWN